MSLTTGTEVVTLDGAGIALTNRDALHIDFLTSFEQADRKLVTRLELGCFGCVDTEFFEDSPRLDTGFCQMTSSGFIDAGGAALTEGDLNGCVAIGFRRFDLRHAVVRHVDHGNRD